MPRDLTDDENAVLMRMIQLAPADQRAALRLHLTRAKAPPSEASFRSTFLNSDLFHVRLLLHRPQ